MIEMQTLILIQTEGMSGEIPSDVKYICEFVAKFNLADKFRNGQSELEQKIETCIWCSIPDILAV